MKSITITSSTFLLMEPNLKFLAYSHTDEEISKACINPMEHHIFEAFGRVIDQWDVMKCNDHVLAVTKALALMANLKDASNFN